jgi:hypothetical protein
MANRLPVSQPLDRPVDFRGGSALACTSALYLYLDLAKLHTLIKWLAMNGLKLNLQRVTVWCERAICPHVIYAACSSSVRQ